jgi:hypothetical protein
MPRITVADTYVGDDPGYEFLNPKPNSYVSLHFHGSTLPTTLEIRHRHSDTAFSNGVISALPTTITIGPISVPMALYVNGGSPDFSVDVMSSYDLTN